jgi:hypothetical protein
MPFRVIVEQALKAWLGTGSFKSIVATSGVENINASYALTCIMHCLEDLSLGGQVHVDIYGMCSWLGRLDC